MSDGIILEMADRTCLIPARQHAELQVVEIPVAEGGRVAALYRAIFEPLGGSGRSAWTDQQWCDELAVLGMRVFVAQSGTDDVGVAQLGWSGQGDAAIIVYGVLPAYQGRGLGGDLLTRITRLLWDQAAPNGRPTDRVWLWTRPDEHPHTVLNYQARGYTVTRET